MILDRLCNLGSSTPKAQTLRGRRYEAAKTDRLNKGRWKDASGNPINQDLSEDLETLCARIGYECQNNGLVDGVIDTHITDIIGAKGPLLQVVTKNKKYAKLLERIWLDWWAMPDINGRMSGQDFLEDDIQMYWKRGEFLTQITNDSKATGKIKLRLQQIHPRRLRTPFSNTGDSSITLGIKRTRSGRHIEYYITEENDGEFGFSLGDKFETVSANSILHDFIRKETGQVRGVPYLASGVEPIADLRDFGVQTLDAARQAADFAVMLTATGPNVEPVLATGSSMIERRTITTAPMGYDVTQLRPEQPTTTYVQYIRERLRELGRPVSMPLLVILCDASNHNYSSARFDSQKYLKGCAKRQVRFERVKLNRCVLLVAREAQLGRLLPAPPDDLKLEWVWPGEPHVDLKKEAEGEDIELSNALKTYRQACAKRGYDSEVQLDSIQEEVADFAKRGLTHPFMQDTSRVKGITLESKDEDKDEKDSPERSDSLIAGREQLNGSVS